MLPIKFLCKFKKFWKYRSQAGNGECAGFVKKHVVVTASYAGVKQKMILRSSRNGSGKGSVWSTQWEWNLPHSVSSAEKFVVCFEILIDFKPDCVASVKKGTKHVLGYLEKLWEKKTMSDVTFKCGDEFINAHTLILASGSPVLRLPCFKTISKNIRRGWS